MLSTCLVVFILWLPFMALDAQRFEWSQVPVALQVVGGLLVLGNFAVVARTARENTFLALVVKSQADRGQRVISSGPHAVVRHPMYAGALLLVFGTSRSARC